jgi:hypothetical protein
MIMANRSEVEKVSDVISGRSFPSDETFCSIAILSDRLEGLKEMSPVFADVSFSENMEALIACEMASTLG